MDPPSPGRAQTPRISAQMQGKKQLPPSARCNAHVEVWYVECGVRRVVCEAWSAKRNVHVHVHVYVLVQVYVQRVEIESIWF